MDISRPYAFFVLKNERMIIMANTKSENYEDILKYIKENEDKLRIFLSADEKMKEYKYKISGKKSSRTIFMSEKLQFVMNEYCIENDLKIGEFVELAIIEHLNRCGCGDKLQKIIDNSKLKNMGE